VQSRKDSRMYFSATANFVGSGILATVGIVTLTRVRHRRELLFASLPTLFAVHQFIEGFVWLGLDGILSQKVTHNMGAAFMLYAQGLLPFLLPLSVLLFEPDNAGRRRMRPFLLIGALTALYILWALTAYPTQIFVRRNSIVYLNPATNDIIVAGFYVIATCGSLLFSKIKDYDGLWHCQYRHPANRHGRQELCIYLGMVRLCSRRQHHHPRVLLEEPRDPAVYVPRGGMTITVFSPVSRSQVPGGMPAFRIRSQDKRTCRQAGIMADKRRGT
jgi:hypothetical protein